MNLLAFSLTCFVNIAIAIFSMSRIHDWLADTGIEFIVGRIFAFPALIALAFGILTVIAIFAVLFYAPKLLPPIYLISLAGATGCVFLGIRIIMQPNTFFVGYGNIWKFYLNTAKTGYVQERLGCCGYNRPREFDGDNCTISVTTPCMKRIIAEFSGAMQIGGLQILLHGLSFGVLLYYAIMAPCPSVLLLPPMDQGTPLLMNQGNQPQQPGGQMFAQSPQSPQNAMYSNPTIPIQQPMQQQQQMQQQMYGMNQCQPMQQQQRQMFMNTGQPQQQIPQQIRQAPASTMTFASQPAQTPQQIQQQLGMQITPQQQQQQPPPPQSQQLYNSPQPQQQQQQQQQQQMITGQQVTLQQQQLQQQQAQNLMSMVPGSPQKIPSSDITPTTV